MPGSQSTWILKAMTNSIKTTWTKTTTTTTNTTTNTTTMTTKEEKSI